MFVKVPNFLTEDDLKIVDQVIAAGSYVDGENTTGAATKPVKNNNQLSLTDNPHKDSLMQVLNRVMNTNATMRASVLPKRMTQPLISKYEPGMHYGWHIDNALMMAPTGPLRSDVACTIFLSDRKDYEGGELMVRTPGGDVQVKLDRGDAFLYPAVSRHQVKEVTSGERLVIVMWIQSMVADAGKREILYELELCHDRLQRENPKSEAISHLQKTQANLIRRWAET